jgi:hypothetical protein
VGISRVGGGRRGGRSPHPALPPRRRRPYWPAARQIIEDRFTTIPFSFDEVAAPAFEMRVRWTLEDYAKYLGTQSATDRYRQAHAGRDPVPAFVADVSDAWGGLDRSRDVHFPLFVRAGRPTRRSSPA